MRRPIPSAFGKPTQEHDQVMRQPPGRLAGLLKGITVRTPPIVEDVAIRREMDLLRRHIASPTLDAAFCEECDRDVVPVIVRMAEGLGVRVDQGELDEITQDLIPVIMRLKYRFNFPRPWQVSAALGTPLLRFVSPSSQTPSYPSGHSIQAAVACTLLSERSPQDARSFDRLATSIGVPRLQLGVHFPMDVVEGLKIGREIGRRIAG